MGDASSMIEDVLLCVLPFPEPADIIARIGKNHPHIKVVYRQMTFARFQAPMKLAEAVPEGTYLIALLFREATILCTLKSLPPSLEAARNLKFIHFVSAGTDRIGDSPIYTDTDIPLTTSSGIHGPMISEWVILQILSASHKQKMLIEWQNQHEWRNETKLGLRKDSVGIRFGVLGYGSIGRQAARVCKAMGMDVIAYTASPRTTPESKKDNGYIVPGTGDKDGTIPSAWYSGTDTASLHNFLSQDIDILLVSVPLTKSTTHLLGAPEFAILGSKRNAFILNISRGSILKQDDLVTYLRKSPAEGGLRGAALDVTEPDPLPKDSELWDLENLMITPHISALSDAYQDRAMQVLEINLANLEVGRPLINVVDRKKGY